MTPAEQSLIEQVLASQVGRHAKFRAYDRSLKSPMNFVLDDALAQVGGECIVYWVDGGLPELFALPGFASTPVVYNTRYIELGYLMRRLFAQPLGEEHAKKLSARTSLRVMAELALRHGGAEWAVRAFLKSIVGQGIFLIDVRGSGLMQLEQEPIGEPYMATWFFGLLHELGHCYENARSGDGSDVMPDSVLLAALEAAIERFPYPADLKAKASIDAAAGRPNFELTLRHLRGEVRADSFATLALFRVTMKIIQQVGKEFRVEAFLQELVLALAIVGALERCKAAASAVKTRPENVTPDRRDELLLRPVSQAVRALMVRRQSLFLLAHHLFGSMDEEHVARCEHLVDQINATWSPKIDVFESGLAQAMRFAFFPAERESNLLTLFAEEVNGPSAEQQLFEAKAFCALAESCGVETESLAVLKRIADSARPTSVAD